MKKHILSIFLIYGLLINLKANNQTSNQSDNHPDMLTPAYYSVTNPSFRQEVDNFVAAARKIPFQHPMQNIDGTTLSYSIGRGFGEGIGPQGQGSHHPAIDYYPPNRQTEINLYACHDGIISNDTTVDRYRHFLSITKAIVDSDGDTLGTMVTVLAHVDLDLDMENGLNLHGKKVVKGDLISKNLYSGTRGGPHLHLEIRYYRKTDIGIEDFYGGNVGEKTEVSTGDWSYGYWNPNSGYGFADPYNHLNNNTSNRSSYNIINTPRIIPNPATHEIKLVTKEINYGLRIMSMQGKTVYRDLDFKSGNSISLQNFPSGIYYAVVYVDNIQSFSRFIKH